MKNLSLPGLGVLAALLFYSSGAVTAQGQSQDLSFLRSTNEQVAPLLEKDIDNYALFDGGSRSFFHRDPCKVFIGVETSSVPEGLKVDRVIENTPAVKYGVQNGDVIVAIDHAPVKTQTELVRERDKHQQGEAFTLTILRNGMTTDVQARFRECTAEEQDHRKLIQEVFAAQTHPILGIYEDESKQVEGIVVKEAIAGKGAAAAGLQSGDVITSVDGKTVTGISALHEALATHKAGEPVTVVYQRNGAARQVNVTLSPGESGFSFSFYRNPCSPFIGVYTGASGPDGQGVRVSGIVDDTPAKKSGVQAGDVILALDGQFVNSQPELLRERDKHKAGDAFRLTLLRAGSKLEINAIFKSCDDQKPALVNAPAPVDDRSLPVSTLQVESLNIFPNPTAGPLTVQFDAEAVPTTVRIADMTGRIVYSNSLNQFDGHFSEEINLWKETPGIYVVSIQQGKKIQYKKIMLITRA
jgi:S1-C subfamily serine protease